MYFLQVVALMLVVTDYGARPNGITDCTAAIQAAIDSAPAGEILFFTPGRYKLTAPLVLSRAITLQGSGAGCYSTDVFGGNGWTGIFEHGSVLEYAGTSGAILTFNPAPTFQQPCNLRDLTIKGQGDATRTTIGVLANRCSRSVWSNVTVLNCAIGVQFASAVESDDNVFTNLVVNGCAIGFLGGPVTFNQNTFLQFNATACDVGFQLVNAANVVILGGAFQGCRTWAADLYATESGIHDTYFENVNATGGAILCRATAPGVGDANHFRRCHFGTPADHVRLDSNGNLVEVLKYSVGTITLNGHGNRVLGNHTGGYVDNSVGNSRQPYGDAPILATGAGRTVDQVIAALQTLGLVKQA
jgi:polygalacturonase